MTIARYIIAIAVLLYTVFGILSAVRQLNVVAQLAPIFGEGQAVMQAAPAAFFPVYVVVLLAYLVSCVDKD